MSLRNFCEIFILLFGIFQTGDCIRCFECVSRSGPGELNACLTGDGTGLRRVHCIGPSVCAKYYYEARLPGQPTIHHITRGCQALRYGATCEDIFHELRAKGEILPGRHTCTTCSTDLCNSANIQFNVQTVFIILGMLIVKRALS